MVNLYGISNLFGAITNLAIAAFVFVKGDKSKICKRWAIFTVSVAIYSFGAYMASGAANSNSAFFWWQFSYVGVIFIPILFMWFVYAFLGIKETRFIKMCFFLSFLILLTDIFSRDLFIGNVSLLFISSRYFQPAWWVYPPGPVQIFHTLVFYVGAISYVFILLLKAYKKSSSQLKRVQIKYLSIAMLLSFLGGGSSYLPCFGINIYPVLNATVPLYPLFITYIIIRHQLMNIEIVIKRTLVYSIVITIITIFYFILVYIIEKTFSQITGYKSIPLAITVIAFFSIIFTPLKNHIQRIIDKYFFHGSIDQINEENIKLRDEIQKTEKLKTIATLAAGMAHEIKNPLTGIKTFTEYLPKKYNNPEFIEKFQRIVGSEVDRINYIVKQLLEFAKPRELELKKIDINMLINETTDLLNSELLKYNIKLVKNYDKLSQIQIDPVQMKQVFLNLLINAIESMREGGTLTIETKPLKHKQISIIIKDTGKGIDKEDLKHIFDPFFTKKDGGTGLGLNVVHGIVTKHVGTIKVQSIFGKGTSFQIVLPLK
ncbi:MAG: ATP-binding protein [Candidatus Omnitrophota bacterium]